MEKANAEKMTTLESVYESYRRTTCDGEPFVGVNKVTFEKDGRKVTQTNLVYGKGVVKCLVD